MPAPSILFLEVDPDDQKSVLARFPKARLQKDLLQGDALVEACKDAEVLSCFVYTKFTKEVIEKLPKLKLLCTRSVGFDHIDVDACRAKGIQVCNVPDYGSHVIAEHVFALVLSVLRHIGEGGKRVSQGEFDYHGLKGMALMGKTVGVVGTGKIGRFVCKIAHGFGMHILATDQCRTLELERDYGVTYVDLQTLLRASDIVSLHLPVFKETMHIINDDSLSQMRDGAILVNTARGELIDSSALLRALESGKIAYALLDVLEHEKDYTLNKSLIDHPHVVVTPHIAFYADTSMQRMYHDTYQSIDEWLAGKEPMHLVKPHEVVCDLPPVKK